MARLPYPDPEDLPEEARALLGRLPPLNIFRMLAGTGPAFAPFIGLINAYLNEGVLPAQARELVILRIGHRCGSAYERFHHENVARKIGIAPACIAAVAGPVPSPVFSAAENAALLFVDDLIERTAGDVARLDSVRAHFGERGVQELILIVGIYMLVCRYIETLGIELEPAPLPGTGLDEIRSGAALLTEAGRRRQSEP
jgi:4-carboxymuconolactone decarboxylase